MHFIPLASLPTAGRLCVNPAFSQIAFPSSLPMDFQVTRRHRGFFSIDSNCFSRLKKKVKVFATFVAFKFPALH